MNKFNKSNIIILALIYNYISNQKVYLEINKFERFINELNYELFLQQEEMVDDVENSEQDVYCINNGIIEFKTEHKLPYALINIKRKYVDILPSEIIIASLATNVLSSINVLRDKIHITTCLEPKYIVNNPYKPLQEKRTKIKNLKKPNIETQSTYKINYVYSVEKTIVNLDDSIEEYEKRLNLN